MKKAIFFSMIIIFSLTNIAFAHHLWIEKEGDRFRVAWGHPPKISPYEPDRLKDIKAFDLKGKEIILKRTDEKDRAYVYSNIDVSMITLSFKGGFLVSTLDGKKGSLKEKHKKQVFR
ncbi:MAG: hypothetical protein ACOYU0_09520 [Nitrospirota bacterium]